ncbi:MAG: diacylglycerol kinase family protein [Bacteroidota bacterium]
MMKQRIQSFTYAFRGIKKALIHEPNLRIHAVATVLVVAGGLYFQIPPWAWVAQTLAIGMVWSAELFNTVWEEYLDFVHPEHSPKVGLVKDIAAGAVLVVAISALVVGLIIYIPYIKALLSSL